MPVNNKPYREAGDVSSFAIRRVNPFLGVLQVLEMQGGRAISSNGVVWSLAICIEQSDHLLKSDATIDQVKRYRYGMWSEEDGLVSRTLNAAGEADHLKLLCDALISCVQARIHLLPFQLVDTEELWLFDKEEKTPIALLASKTPDAIIPSPEPKYWTSHLGADGMPGQARFPESRELEEQVADAASLNIRKHWVTRHLDNSGFVEDLDISLKAKIFPVYMLSEDWPDKVQADRVKNYIDWISPSLLTLQHLDQRQRARLESRLYTQAVSVEHHWHLYPDVLDEKIINAARVQSQIQKSQCDHR